MKTGMLSSALNALLAVTVARVIPTVPCAIRIPINVASLRLGPALCACAFKDFTKIPTIPKTMSAFSATFRTVLLVTAQLYAQSAKTSYQGLG